ncbi:MAG TPA: ELWxxDGT repeat protein [Thermoanaerobaculia bacterium]|nr:ELWxxDGT repeat protein [Thermoanaerobaculia bacterium]
MFRFLSALSLLLVSLALPASAAELVADLQPHEEPRFLSVQILDLLSLGERAVFIAQEPSSGHELWASDGTSLGTELLRDLCSGPCSSSLAFLGAIGGNGLVIADAGQLWRTDGTRQGTTLVTPNGPSPCGGVVDSAVLGGTLLFSAFDPDHGCELWRTDGTAAGTHLLADLISGESSAPAHLTAAGGRVFFAASTEITDHGLWRSDGTAAGTVLVRSFAERVVGLHAVGADVLFLHWGGSFSELWQSDGTAAGTVRIAAFDDPQAFDPFREGVLGATALGSRVIFRASGGEGKGQRIWTSAPGSQAALLAGCPGGCPQVLAQSPLVPFGGRILFPAYGPAFSVELWSTDGTGAGTRKLATICQEAPCSLWPEKIVPMPSQVFFLAGTAADFALWRTDGTAAGTVRVAAQRRDPNFRDLRAAQAGNRLVFAGLDAVLGPELWASDGTEAGTGPLTVLGESESSSSNPTGLVAFGDQVVFRASRGSSTSLWRSGGTAASTAELTDLPPSAGPADRPAGVPVAGLFFFLKPGEDEATQLWRTDGTVAGTLQLTPEGIGYVGEPVAFGGKAVAPVSSEGVASLWESDGTPAGTRKLFDLPADIRSARSLSSLGPEIWFVAQDELGYGRQLYRTDGTAAGTHEVITSENGFFFGDPLKLVRFGSHVFFAASSNGVDAVWRTDGTSADTVPVLYLTTESGDARFTDLAELQGSLYLITRNGLWKLNATADGMVLLKEFAPLFRLAWPAFARLNGRLFFAAADAEHGIELWRTDGTAEGTVLVRDISPGTASSSPQDLEAAGGRVFFNAGDEDHGRELWESNGTEEGTRLVQDIAPGALSSSPYELTAAGGKLFFAADDLFTGFEPWVHLLSGPACQPSTEVLCLGGGRFRVEAFWRDFQGHEGRDKAVALTADTGYFWFFDPANVEVILKALDGQGLNGHHWVFYGALSTVEYALTVTDTLTGAARRYVNPPGRLGSVGDTRAFGPLGAHSSEPAAVEHEPIVLTGKATAANCAPSATRLCLQGGRFAVEIQWTDFQGNHGVGKAVSLTGDTGYFWFFNEDNVEVVLKVLDGRPLNDKFWVFYGALSSVEYTITVTDTQTGKTRTYHNPPGRLASVADTSAF